MNIDENQSVQAALPRTKKYLRQNDVVAKLGMQLTQSSLDE